MLKRILKYGVALTLSVIFCIAACGFNMAKYCCPECRSKGIMALVSTSCEHQEKPVSDCCHAHKKQIEKSSCGHNCKNDGCKIVHFKVDDTDFLVNSFKANIGSHSILFHAILLKQVQPHLAPILTLTNNSPPGRPAPPAGRTVLCSICSFLI
jgi:hypothetical protein